MPTIRVMSWNIENIGTSKVNWQTNLDLSTGSLVEFSATIDYIVSVIKKYRLDVLAIMEVRGFEATKIQRAIIAGLGGNNWRGEVSSQQATSRREQSIFLWNSDCEAIAALNEDAPSSPSECWSHSVIDDNSMRRFFRSIGCDGTTDDAVARRLSIYETLEKSGYIKLAQTAIADEKKNVKRNVGKKRPRDGDDDESGDEDYGDGNANADGDSDEEDFYSRQRSSSTEMFWNEHVNSTETYVLKTQSRAKKTLPANTPMLRAYYISNQQWDYISAAGNSNTPLVLYTDTDHTMTTDLGLSDLDLINLRHVLSVTSVIQFPLQGYRSPFTLNLLLKDVPPESQNLSLSVLHAPGPEDEGASGRMKFQTINNLAMSGAFQTTPNLLMMGDFNIESTEFGQQTVPVYVCDNTGYHASLVDGVAQTETLASPFFPLTGRLNAAALLAPGLLTSLTTGKSNLRTGLEGLSTMSRDYLSEPFDKFFLKSVAPAYVTSDVFDRVDLIITAQAYVPFPAPTVQNAPAQLTPDQEIARAAMNMYRAKRTPGEYQAKIQTILNTLIRKLRKLQEDEQPSRKTKPGSGYTAGSTTEEKRDNDAIITQTEADLLRDEISGIQNAANTLEDLLFGPTIIGPSNMTCSFLIYREFSDHLPILTELQINPPQQ